MKRFAFCLSALLSTNILAAQGTENAIPLSSVFDEPAAPSVPSVVPSVAPSVPSTAPIGGLRGLGLTVPQAIQRPAALPVAPSPISAPHSPTVSSTLPRTLPIAGNFMLTTTVFNVGPEATTISEVVFSPMYDKPFPELSSLIAEYADSYWVMAGLQDSRCGILVVKKDGTIFKEIPLSNWIMAGMEDSRFGKLVTKEDGTMFKEITLSSKFPYDAIQHDDVIYFFCRDTRRMNGSDILTLNTNSLTLRFPNHLEHAFYTAEENSRATGYNRPMRLEGRIMKNSWEEPHLYVFPSCGENDATRNIRIFESQMGISQTTSSGSRINGWVLDLKTLLPLATLPVPAGMIYGFEAVEEGSYYLNTNQGIHVGNTNGWECIVPSGPLVSVGDHLYILGDDFIAVVDKSTRKVTKIINDNVAEASHPILHGHLLYVTTHDNEPSAPPLVSSAQAIPTPAAAAPYVVPAYLTAYFMGQMDDPSTWSNNSSPSYAVCVIDTRTHQVVKRIRDAASWGQMVRSGSYLYLCKDDSVTVINADKTQKVLKIPFRDPSASIPWSSKIYLSVAGSSLIIQAPQDQFTLSLPNVERAAQMGLLPSQGVGNLSLVNRSVRSLESATPATPSGLSTAAAPTPSSGGRSTSGLGALAGLSGTQSHRPAPQNSELPADFDEPAAATAFPPLEQLVGGVNYLGQRVYRMTDPRIQDAHRDRMRALLTESANLIQDPAARERALAEALAE